jgi:hypothetical protein
MSREETIRPGHFRKLPRRQLLADRAPFPFEIEQFRHRALRALENERVTRESADAEIGAVHVEIDALRRAIIGAGARDQNKPGISWPPTLNR